MADVDPGDIIRVGAGLSFEGVYDVVNVWHLLMDAALGTDWAAFTPSLQTYMDTLYASLKNPLSSAIGTNVLTVSNVTQLTTIGAIAWSPTWAGGDAGEYTSPGVCCFTWGRTYAPRVQIRKYFGIFAESDVVNGVWTVATQIACTAVMDYHIVPHAIGPTWTFEGVAYNRTLATYQRAVSSDSSAEPAYQRRRKRGRGS